MANLKEEYTDIKDIAHKVEHLTVLEDEKNNKERITEELINTLTRSGNRR